MSTPLSEPSLSSQQPLTQPDGGRPSTTGGYSPSNQPRSDHPVRSARALKHTRTRRVQIREITLDPSSRPVHPGRCLRSEGGATVCDGSVAHVLVDRRPARCSFYRPVLPLRTAPCNQRPRISSSVSTRRDSYRGPSATAVLRPAERIPKVCAPIPVP